MQNDLQRLMRDPNLIPSEKQTLISNLAGQAAEMDMPCYIVGGFVRRLLLGKPVNGLDIVVEGDAIKFGNELVKKLGGRLTIHPKFHTAIWHLPDSIETLDLVTARTETYPRSGALPTIAPSTIDHDLRRRDFTVNAMAIRIDGAHFPELLDPLNGQADLEKKVIRVLHPQSFIDDPTRIFRAIRYSERYSFAIEPETLNLINAESLGVIRKLSGERLRHELDLILEEENSLQMILRASDLDVFRYIHPDLPPFNENYSDFLEMDTTLDVPASRTTMGYILWMLNLSETKLLDIAHRLDFSTELTHAVWGAAQLKKSLPFLVESKPSIWTFALEKLPLLSIYAVYLVTGEGPLLNYISLWRHVKPRTTGNDLIALGLQPSPKFGEILFQLRAAWLDGDVQNESQEKELLTRLL
jgi:tRNA nucleotidyltransferase (CCA-adding enzyme)